MALTEGIRGYGELLGRRDVRPMVVWGLVARLPMGMTALALILLVRGAGGSYAAAGAVSAANAVAAAIGAPVGGRLIDRHEPTRVLEVYAVCQPAALALLVGLSVAGAPIWTLGVTAAAAGLCYPPVQQTVRTIWPALLGDERLRSVAFALEATLQEVFFVSGPLIVGALTALISPNAGIVATAVLSLVGVTAFARTAPVRAREGAGAPPHQHPLAALGPVAVRRLLAYCVGLGLAFGAVEVALPAFAEEHGGRALSGIILAAWSGGSLAGGVLAAGNTGLRLVERLRLTSLAFAGLLVLPLFADSIASMTVVMFFAGMPIAPSLALTYNLLERTARSGTRAEVFGWVSTAIVVGVAAGTAVGGSLVSTVGIHGSLGLGIAGAATAAAVALLPLPAGRAPVA